MGSREPKHLSCPTHGAVWGTIYADGAVDYDCGCHAPPTPPAPADDLAWLLETADQSHRYLVKGGPGVPCHMTSDPWRATRWDSKEEALICFALIGGGTLAALGIPDDLRPVRHGFAQPAPADDATRESAPASGEVFVYRPASWKGQAPDDAKGRDDVKWVCRRADDASGAEAMREASGHSGEASKRATAFVEAMDASPCPHSDADWSESDCGYCLAAALDRFAAPLPARDDAVEEAMAPGCHEHVALWDAINAYSAACGGHPTRGGGARMDAVVRVEKALRAALRRAKGCDRG